MTTECNTSGLEVPAAAQAAFSFHNVGSREVVARFDGGTITSDGGVLLLREVERQTGILEQFAECFVDHRDPELIEHTVEELVSQRVLALALGYEDLNDHDDLRRDPLLAVAVGKADPTGANRTRKQDQGKPLAGKSTLNRLELTPFDATAGSRYKKIVIDKHQVGRFFTRVFLQAHAQPPGEIVLDLDATDDPVHGHQQGRFFHGYYDGYCYLPLYIFCGEFLLYARLRPSNIDASAGSVKELDRIVRQIRAVWPQVRIIVRGDSGFCREKLMAWCERNGVHFVLGLAKNERLLRILAGDLEKAKALFDQSGQASRVFADFEYQTLDSWSRSRRVVGKAEHLKDGSNPRFVITSLSAEEVDARTLYEQRYCARGEMENRIKEQQLYLFADRTSAATLRANQQRLWFSSVAYALMQALRRLGLQGTSMATAQCHTIRTKLLKIGAKVQVTVRKVWVSLTESCPYAGLFAKVIENLRRALQPTGLVLAGTPPLRC